MISKTVLACALIAFASVSASAVSAKPKAKAKPAPAPVTRVYDKPESAIARVNIVPDGYETIYVSGALPDIADPAAPKGSIASYGNTETQTESVLKKLEATLKTEGVSFKDVVSMHVYLVGDPALEGKLDFMGMMKAYQRHFGTPEQPNRPTRATVQVAGLVAPGFLVEIEIIAVRPKKK